LIWADIGGTVILILKRDDLPQKLRDWAVESIKLDHFAIPGELVGHAELIVFVEGSKVKFLKHLPQMQSKDTVDVLMSYITSTTPTMKEHPVWRLKPYGQRQQKKNNKEGAIKRICINKLRKRSQDYYEKLRKKKVSPEFVRQLRHRLSEIDTKKMRAVCAVCGPTDILRNGSGKDYTNYLCATNRKQSSEAYRRERGIPPRNPSHHHLSQIDDENKTAVCSRCGSVPIYVSDLGYRIQRRCKNAPREYTERMRQNNQPLQL
jgi:hypothetical protein